MKNYLLRNGLTFIYVSYDKYMTDYDTYKFFIGPPSDMEQVQIDNFVRYKKGKEEYVIRFNIRQM